MKSFTPELMELLDSPDVATADAADAEWDRRLDEYARHLQEIDAGLPDHVREYNALLLHDACVQNIAQDGDQLIMVLRKDIPPRDVVILTYNLLTEPVIDRGVLPPERRSTVMDYLYNEFDVLRAEGEVQYVESILFSNGWEMRLHYRDVRVTIAAPLYLPEMGLTAPAALAAPGS